MKRVAVVGATGSGKTTFSARLGALLGAPHVELDALHWDAGWVEAPLETFRERVETALSGDCWIADGSYSKVRDVVWGRADTLVWLDFALPVVMVRLVRRTLVRTLAHTELWNGNRERFTEAFLSRDSLVLWLLKQHPRHRREYPAAFQDPRFEHLAVVRLRTPLAASRWLARVPTAAQIR